MKISTRGRYALRIMLDVAMNSNGKPVSFKEVSQRQNISLKYMEQIGALLTRAGFLRSVRGAQGGYNLVGVPADYTIGMILRVTEGQLSPVPCLADGKNSCPNSADCLTIPLWEKLNDAIFDVIDNMTLQDLIDIGKERRIIVIDGTEEKSED
ncbi:MAG: Rrf2 family transcriptional regulator [Thermoplasmata archaeon]|nr:Rrf2 family transcriptional regulator [Thermoplasmata archaeon]